MLRATHVRTRRRSSPLLSPYLPLPLFVLSLFVLPPQVVGFELSTRNGCAAFGTDGASRTIRKTASYRRIGSSTDVCRSAMTVRTIGSIGDTNEPRRWTFGGGILSSFPIPSHACRPTHDIFLSSSYRYPSPGLLSSKTGGDDDGNDTSDASSTDKPNYGAINDDDDDIDDNEPTSTGTQILSLAVPALAGLAIDPILTLVDTAFIGRTAASSDALAGVGSAAALETFAFYVFNFLCTATTPLLSEKRAKGDEEGAVAVGGQALTLALVLGVVLAGGLVVWSEELLGVMGTGSTGVEANAYALSYLRIRALAAPAVFFASAGTGILRGYLDTKTAFAVLAVANVVNFGLDVVLILGLGMGPTGAAIATTVAEWVAAGSFLGVLLGVLPSVDGELGRNRRTPQGGPSDEPPIVIAPTSVIPPWKQIEPLVVASSSLFLRSVALQLALAGGAAMAARSSTAASASVAAHQIALQLWLLTSFVCDALAAASQALVSDALGRNDPVAVRAVARTVFIYALGLGFVLGGVLAVGEASGFLLGLFTKDGGTQEALAPLLTLLVVAQPLNSLVFAADGILQGASEFGFQAKAMVLSVAVAVVSFEVLEYFWAGGGGDTLFHVWCSLLVLQGMRGITSFVKLVDEDAAIALFGG